MDTDTNGESNIGESIVVFGLRREAEALKIRAESAEAKLREQSDYIETCEQLIQKREIIVKSEPNAGDDLTREYWWDGFQDHRTLKEAIQAAMKQTT